MRKTYGNTWWGKEWLNAFNNIDYSNRLPRGRSYANTGKVKKININENKISGSVKGTRPRPYAVDIKVPLFGKAKKERILNLIIEDPMLLSQLLNRELPSYLNDIFKKNGIHLFPESWDDLTAKCSCPDWAVPCKHLAAVLYLIANEIDKNPFLVFELHGLEVIKELEKKGFSLGNQKQITIPNYEDFWQQKAEKWEMKDEELENIYQQLDFTKITESRANLLAILEDRATFYPSKSFKVLLEKNYSKVARAVSRLIKKTDAVIQEGIVFERVESLQIQLNEDREMVQTVIDNGDRENLVFEDIESLIHWLESIPAGRIQKYIPALQAVYLAYRFAEKLAQKSAFIPQLIVFSDNHHGITWIPALLNEAIRTLAHLIGQLIPSDLIYQGKKEKKSIYLIPKERSNQLFSLFLNYFVEEYGLEVKPEDNIGLLFFKNYLIEFKRFEDKEFPSAIHLYLSRFFISEKDYVPLMQVVENREEETFDVEILVEEKNKKEASLPISLKDLFANQSYQKIRLEVLRDLATLSNYFPDIQKLISSKGKEPLVFEYSKFANVLLQILPTIRLFGIKTLLPKSLKKLLRPKLSLAIYADDESPSVKPSGVISLDNLLKFNWQVALGDKVIKPEEFEKMVREMSGIVRFGEDYAFFDEREIKALLDKLENPPKLTPQELFQIALAENYNGSKVLLTQEAQGLMQSILLQKTVAPPKNLKATLRPYQQRGYEWMYKNTTIGFGSLIADDMGLGKTLQVITTLLKLKEEGLLRKKKGLIIVPTTLLTNWAKEIIKFAPSLGFQIYHGSKRKLDTQNTDLLITTYGIARSDADLLQKQKWLVLVIDEAQNIKNPSTAQTKVIKKIKADIKIAMSGTPVENRLSEYWSIFDFVNKGYLSTLGKFKERFAIPIEMDRDRNKARLFQTITAPFIMRRLKSDKRIIKDLPDKVEMNQYCQLTKEQSVLYQSVVNDLMRQIESTEGVSRKGAILKLITSLKQVCNHPTQFLKKGKIESVDSGKSIQLLDLLKRIEKNGEKTLIFTQYQMMGNLMLEMIRKEMGFVPSFLHGGVPRKKRDEMVEDFQNNRASKVLILSLKAGGTGLNLTAANNVIHYDLWWNPAVEAQATDRAYRIGQQKNVVVHRFITQKTFEEKIDQLLQSKKDLANMTVASGETWIGDLTNTELQQLVRLEG